MGLDMNLEIENYVSSYREDSAPLLKKLDEVIGEMSEGAIPTLDVNGFVTVTNQVGYWRKANAIHAWFVDNVQNGVDECQRSYVDPAILGELRDLCLKLTDLRNDPDRQDEAITMVNEELPPQSGFFFGSTDIDENYWYDVRVTGEFLDEFLAWHENNNTWSIYYQSSW